MTYEQSISTIRVLRLLAMLRVINYGSHLAYNDIGQTIGVKLVEPRIR